MVNLHHSTIIARNRTDIQGSEFIIRIPAGCDHLQLEEIEKTSTDIETITPITPIKKEVNIEEWNQETNEAKKIKAKKNLHILIVDDEKEIQKFLKDELSADYNIDVCNNGKEAYEYLLSNTVNLVVSDVMMPEIDGFTLCKKIKQNTNINHIPVILLTAKGRTEDQLEGLDIGADSYLVKPFNIEILRKVISNLLNSSRILKNKFSGAQEQSDKIQQIQMKSSDEVLMEKVMKIINENLSEPTLSVEMLASKVGLSRVHLHRKLKELTNLSSRDFIRNIRMQQAAKLLKEKKLTVSEVAYAVGYNNMSHFSNRFKENFGVSPKEYMQNSQKEEKNKPATQEEKTEDDNRND